ncbi:MAG: hypothetical protein ABIF82_04090 [Planctomycetota bacterium]
MSNREESMARVLSRADFHEGTVLRAHRAASSSLVAVLAENGRGHGSDRCADICGALAAHGVANSLDRAKCIRGFFNTVLTKQQRAFHFLRAFFNSRDIFF